MFKRCCRIRIFLLWGTKIILDSYKKHEDFKGTAIHPTALWDPEKQEITCPLILILIITSLNVHCPLDTNYQIETESMGHVSHVTACYIFLQPGFTRTEMWQVSKQAPNNAYNVPIKWPSRASVWCLTNISHRCVSQPSAGSCSICFLSLCRLLVFSPHWLCCSSNPSQQSISPHMSVTSLPFRQQDMGRNMK